MVLKWEKMMEATLYPQMAALEKKHWWFSARRSIIEHMLKKTIQ